MTFFSFYARKGVKKMVFNIQFGENLDLTPDRNHKRTKHHLHSFH